MERVEPLRGTTRPAAVGPFAAYPGVVQTNGEGAGPTATKRRTATARLANGHGPFQRTGNGEGPATDRTAGECGGPGGRGGLAAVESSGTSRVIRQEWRPRGRATAVNGHGPNGTDTATNELTAWNRAVGGGAAARHPREWLPRAWLKRTWMSRDGLDAAGQQRVEADKRAWWWRVWRHFVPPYPWLLCPFAA